MIRFHLTPFPWWPKSWNRYYIHIMGRPDGDRECHDHPWGFSTLILFGGYDEVSHVMKADGTPSGKYATDHLKWLSFRRRSNVHAHRITRLHTKRVVTFVARDNGRSRDWGFWTGDMSDKNTELSVGYGGQPVKWKWVLWSSYMNVEPRNYTPY